MNSLQQTTLSTYTSTDSLPRYTNEHSDDYLPKNKSNVINPHDKFFKETFSDVSIAKDFLRNYLPEKIFQVTDLQSLEPEKDTFIDSNLDESFSDLLFKTTIHDEAGYFYFLFEHKSYPSKQIALQLLRYMTDIWKTKAQKEREQLPIIIPLVIYHGKTKWNTPTSLDKMIVGYHTVETEVQKYVPNFHYLLYDLSFFSERTVYKHI